MKHVVFLAVGTGIGAKIIIDGKRCLGSEDISGSVGWFALNPEFRKEYSDTGCFEAQASGNAVARKAIKLIKDGESSIMEKSLYSHFYLFLNLIKELCYVSFNLFRENSRNPE